ncbi:hypothetical protein ES702_00553 [subsurface metagenome]
MSNPKAEKAKAIYERIQSADRLVQLAMINKEIEEDPDFNALDKMNLGSIINLKMRDFTEGTLDKAIEVIKEDRAKPNDALYPEPDPEDKRSPYRQKVGQLYTTFFVAAGGHPSLVKRNFERYMDEVTSVIKRLPQKYEDLLDDWEAHRWNGRHLSLDDDLYWHTDHMTIIRGDFKKILEEAEEAIRKYYKEDDVDWGFLDLIRRTLHAVELMIDHYDEIRAYIEDAKKVVREEAVLKVGEENNDE